MTGPAFSSSPQVLSRDAAGTPSAPFMALSQPWVPAFCLNVWLPHRHTPCSVQDADPPGMSARAAHAYFHSRCSLGSCETPRAFSPGPFTSHSWFPYCSPRTLRAHSCFSSQALYLCHLQTLCNDTPQLLLVVIPRNAPSGGPWSCFRVCLKTPLSEGLLGHGFWLSRDRHLRQEHERKVSWECPQTQGLLVFSSILFRWGGGDGQGGPGPTHPVLCCAHPEQTIPPKYVLLKWRDGETCLELFQGDQMISSLQILENWTIKCTQTLAPTLNFWIKEPCAWNQDKGAEVQPCG